MTSLSGTYWLGGDRVRKRPGYSLALPGSGELALPGAQLLSCYCQESHIRGLAGPRKSCRLLEPLHRTGSWT